MTSRSHSNLSLKRLGKSVTIIYPPINNVFFQQTWNRAFCVGILAATLLLQTLSRNEFSV